MFRITIDLPDKLQEPMEEVVERFSELNKIQLTPSQLMESVIRNFIAREYGEILKSCKRELKLVEGKKEDKNERSNKKDI